MKSTTFRRTALAASLALLGAGSAHAEFFGLLNGRSADPATLPPLSVEGAFITGDDYQNIGARVNYTVSPTLVVFGDVGLIEIGEGFADADGLGFGLGAFFHLADQQFLEGFDVGLKGSFHFVSLDGDDSVDIFGNRRTFDLDGNNISLEAIVSGQEPISTNGISWYANVGLNILGGDFDENELLFGGGVHLPAGPGQVYAGADWIDDLQFGIGYRYFVQ